MPIDATFCIPKESELEKTCAIFQILDPEIWRLYGKMPKRAVTEGRQRWPRYFGEHHFLVFGMAGPQGALLNPKGGAGFAIDGR